jgi:hypothetical protein
MLVAVALVSLAACQGGGGDSAAGPSTPAPTTAAPGAVPGTCPGFRGETTAVHSVGPTAAATLVDAEAGAEGCVDQVRLTFQTLGDGTPPGYVVEYQDPSKDPFVDGDPPTPIEVPGSAFLVVQVSPALSVNPFVEDTPSTYAGNLSLAYGDHNHLEIVRKLPDADKTVRWVIGLDSVRPFRVDRSEDASAPGASTVTVLIG